MMVDLTQHLRETQGGRYQCPLCDARRGLSLDPDEGDSGLWHCFSCDAGGDGVDLYMILHDAEVAEALEAFGIDRGGKSGSIKRKERQAPIPTAPAPQLLRPETCAVSGFFCLATIPLGAQGCYHF